MGRITALALLGVAGMVAGCGGDTQPEAIESIGGALSTAGQSGPSHAREPHHKPQCPRCGNGIIETGEACDDGNGVGGDGCSSTCQPDDDTTTPGDDRVSFVACGAMTCGPGDLCCFSTQTCRGAAVDCGGPMNPGSDCDGPEDCSPGGGCFATKYGHLCESPSAGGIFGVLCHRNGDCAGVQCPISGGACTVCTAAAGGIGACSGT